MKGCPYKKTFFNPITHTSEKCIACYPKQEQGLSPQCFVNCIGKIRLAGSISRPEKADPSNPVDYLVHVKKLALPLFPQYGLEPNVYYVPPIHVPPAFLTQLFGPSALTAVETYRNAPNDPELSGLLSLFGSTEQIVHRFKRSNDQMIGFDEGGKEIVRVPVKEPVYLSKALDVARDVARHNIP